MKQIGSGQAQIVTVVCFGKICTNQRRSYKVREIKVGLPKNRTIKATVVKLRTSEATAGKVCILEHPTPCLQTLEVGTCKIGTNQLKTLGLEAGEIGRMQM